MVDALVMLSIKTTEVILRFLALDPVDVTAGSLLGRGAGIHHY
jgi:hypothetical protein